LSVSYINDNEGQFNDTYTDCVATCLLVESNCSLMSPDVVVDVDAWWLPDWARYVVIAATSSTLLLLVIVSVVACRSVTVTQLPVTKQIVYN